jgi:hypothetical protein
VGFRVTVAFRFRSFLGFSFFSKIFFKRKKGKKESQKFNGVIQKEKEFSKNTTPFRGGDFLKIACGLFCLNYGVFLRLLLFSFLV